MGIILCARSISKYMERKYIREFRNRRSRVWISRRVFVGVKKRSLEEKIKNQ